MLLPAGKVVSDLFSRITTKSFRSDRGLLLKNMTREEIEQKMVELAGKYLMTHDPEIIKELYRLGGDLEKAEKLEKQ